ncbi:DinB family protein [Gracilibacillus caseinilyticus]|uniref:DinB family protein n=1 Tax=Gracilibacillus caseinilyticus TaxID=2932256 RepID=A0ABY4ESS6_9BACI|nr:DinB family protein [Gracilibacillus caseinilyticus]UOQ46709.1 DinB family protein [Gracilibacillus caseinilyticus]
MNRKEVILNQFKACHNTDTWFVSLQTALKGLPAEQAYNYSAISVHSIFEIVNHLCFYNNLELNRFKGVQDNVQISDNETTFKPLTEKSWELLVEELFQTLERWQSAIEQSDEECIEKNAESLTYINLHNAYHIGQIVFIRKSLGTWNDSQGVHYNV